MSKSHKTRILLITIIFCLCAPQIFAEIVFIGNKNSVPDELSRKDIKRIFLGKQKSWKDASSINVALYTKSKIFDHFSRKYTGRPKYLFRDYWRRLVFTGRGKAPKGFKTEKEVVNYVGLIDGAIGFVSSDAKIENVKIIKISDGGQK